MGMDSEQRARLVAQGERHLDRLRGLREDLRESWARLDDAMLVVELNAKHVLEGLVAEESVADLAVAGLFKAVVALRELETHCSHLERFHAALAGAKRELSGGHPGV